MGIILDEHGVVIRSFIDKNRDSDVDSRLFQTQLLEENDSQTVQQFQLAGFESRPPAGTRLIISQIGSAYKFSIAEDDGILNDTLNEGESTVYGSNSGAVVCSVLLKNDGDIQIDTDKDLIANVDGDLTATVTGATTVNSTGTLELIAPLIKLTGPVECSSTLDTVGNITSEADISADGDVIADALGLAISLINHFHQGNLGFPTPAAIMTGGGTTPSSLPTADASGEITDGPGTKSTAHKHSQGNDSNGDSEVDTGNAHA